MYRKPLLLLTLSLLSCMAYAGAYRCQDANGYFIYTDKPCAGESDAGAAPIQNQPDLNSRTEQSAPDKGAYTKDLAPMRSPDFATQACFSYINTIARFPDPSTTKLLSSSKKWVAVRDVGSRQMVTIGVTSKNDAGMYLGVQSFDCLLMGDNATINTSDYELL
jgi:hypothetical protein